MAEQEKPKFPELAVDKLVADFGKKPSPEKVDEIKKLAEELRPEQERVETVRQLAQKNEASQKRKLGRRR